MIVEREETVKTAYRELPPLAERGINGERTVRPRDPV